MKREPKEKTYKVLKAYSSMENTDFDVETGTRFPKGSARQLAFEHILKGVEAGRTIKDIKKDLMLIRKENGYKYNLDAGYVNFVLSLHPEFFKVFTDGSIKLLKKPVVDMNKIVEHKRKDISNMRKIARRVSDIRKSTSV